VFWPVLVLVATIDFCTKALARKALLPERVPHDVYGEWLRFTLVYNPGAAFGLHVGQYSRWIFMALTLVALVILGRLYTATKGGDLIRTLSLALVCGGAVGNLIDRIMSAEGVVDFIDIGFRDSRWPTFNIADMAVSLGAFLLAWVLWGEDAEVESVSLATTAALPAESRELS
jgi:signal peptidase II